jgi:hypothetical protein
MELPNLFPHYTVQPDYVVSDSMFGLSDTAVQELVAMPEIPLKFSHNFATIPIINVSGLIDIADSSVFVDKSEETLSGISGIKKLKSQYTQLLVRNRGQAIPIGLIISPGFNASHIARVKSTELNNRAEKNRYTIVPLYGIRQRRKYLDIHMHGYLKYN